MLHDLFTYVYSEEDDDDQAHKCVNYAKENSEDHSEKFSKIVNDLYDELLGGGIIYY